MTPFLGVPLSGYYVRREMDAVAGPLYINAVAFGQGGKSAVMLVLDTEGLHKEVGRELPQRVAKELGLDEESVFITCIHTHTGPVVFGIRDPGDPRYDEWFVRRLCDATRMALADRFFGTKSVEWAEHLGEKLFGYVLPLFDQAVSTGAAGLPSYELLPLASQAYVLRGLEELKLDYVDIPVSAVTFCGTAWLSIAGEPFLEIGKHIREHSPFKTTCVCCLTNGGEGYYATAEAYDQGGYEPRNSRFLRGVAETLSQTGVDLLKSM